jgi:hypothetical protein
VASAVVEIELPIIDWVDGAPVNGLNIQKCAAIDALCLEPLGPAATFPDNRSDQHVALALESGFNGLLRIASTDGISLLPDGGPDLTNAYLPEAYYFGDTIYRDRIVIQKIQLLRAPILAQLAGNLGVALDPAAALLVGVALDCNEQPAAGVRFEINKPGIPFTLVGGLPRLASPPSDFIPTDDAGQGGFANLPAGYVFIDAYVALTGTRINRTQVSATALPGQLTVVEVHARPFGVLP